MAIEDGLYTSYGTMRVMEQPDASRPGYKVIIERPDGRWELIAEVLVDNNDDAKVLVQAYEGDETDGYIETEHVMAEIDED